MSAFFYMNVKAGLEANEMLKILMTRHMTIETQTRIGSTKKLVALKTGS